MISAEESVIGALLARPASYWQVAETIGPEDFADPRLRKLWLEIRDMLSTGEDIDAVTVGDRLPELFDFAVTLQQTVYSAANIAGYAGAVRKDAERRRLQQAGKRIAVCDSYDDAQALLAAVRPKQAAVAKTVKDGLREMVEALRRRYEDGSVSGTPTGLENLDEAIGGYQPGDLIILAARPGMGKTALAIQSAIAAGRTMMFSLEMTAGGIVERCVAHCGKLPLHWIRKPLQAPDFAASRVTAASGIVSSLPLLIDDQSSLPVSAISSRARQAHMQEPLRLIIVDHLGLISRPGRNDASELGQVTAELKRLAKDLAIPVVLLCQLNRGLEQRHDKRPVMSDLRDSGRIEEDADVVIGLYREKYYSPNDADDLAEVILLKARNDERKTVWAYAAMAEMRFEPAQARASQPTPVAKTRGFASFGRDRAVGQ